jgi:alpha-galactosidase
MTMVKKTYQRGIGVQSTSVLSFLLNGNATEFSASVGVDDMGNKILKHQFYVLADGKILFESGDMKWGDLPINIKVNLRGVQRMGLLVTVEDQGYTKVYTNFADAKILMIGNAVPLTTPNLDEKYILTPPSPKTPQINSAKVFGATPGNPFLYTIVSTGSKPIEFITTNRF